ncbi:MAG: sodium:proton antiporter [Deltaproteobacteria bacterium]|nr:sodium:proton antiporter [Nannocystaceae bacterium]
MLELRRPRPSSPRTSLAASAPRSSRRWWAPPALLAAATLLLPGVAAASDGAAHAVPPTWMVVFFAAMLLGIAIIPLTRLEHLWHSNLNKLLFGLALSAYPVIWLTVLHPNLAELGVKMHEYASFITLLGSLFFISGGIYLAGDLRCTPGSNTTFLAIGTALASLIGTTGASMLLIRPVLRANTERKHKVHIVVFFIFLVSNVGGSLLPLGDPPLFLGYLQGVPFLWTLGLWQEMFLVSAVLLVIFFVMDRHFYGREADAVRRVDVAQASPLQIEGGINILWLLGIVACAAFIKDSHGLFVREAAMIGCVLGSKFTSPPATREKNAFSWFPIVEVAALFIGIFLTMIPALLILQASGDQLGVDTPAKFFWASGVLSSFLDNAPTYLVFFETAGGMVDKGLLSGALVPGTNVPEMILIAISCGSVFMGANSYIGNGPNFMVKAIAEEQNVVMPSFFGYMRWSIAFLIPCFVLVTLLFF